VSYAPATTALAASTTTTTAPAAAPATTAATTVAARVDAPPTTTAAAPAKKAAQRPKGKVTLPAKPGAVTFDHEAHATTHKVACATCHHASKPAMPLKSEQQACRECHTTPAKAPMKTTLQAAFHDPMAKKGLCVDCHKQKAGKAPLKCAECHKKG
jgi:hypothetical protein